MFVCLLYTRHMLGITDDMKGEQAEVLYTVLSAGRDSSVQVANNVYLT